MIPLYYKQRLLSYFINDEKGIFFSIFINRLHMFNSVLIVSWCVSTKGRFPVASWKINEYNGLYEHCSHSALQYLSGDWHVFASKFNNNIKSSSSEKLYLLRKFKNSLSKYVSSKMLEVLRKSKINGTISLFIWCVDSSADVNIDIFITYALSVARASPRAPGIYRFVFSNREKETAPLLLTPLPHTKPQPALRSRPRGAVPSGGGKARLIIHIHRITTQ